MPRQALLFDRLLHWPHIGVARCHLYETGPTLYVLTGLWRILVPGLLPIFLHGCEKKIVTTCSTLKILLTVVAQSIGFSCSSYAWERGIAVCVLYCAAAVIARAYSRSMTLVYSRSKNWTTRQSSCTAFFFLGQILVRPFLDPSSALSVALGRLDFDSILPTSACVEYMVWFEHRLYYCTNTKSVPDSLHACIRKLGGGQRTRLTWNHCR